MAEKKVQAVRLDLSAKRALVEPGVGAPSIRRQCELIGLNRSSWYVQETPASESAENLARKTLRLPRRLRRGGMSNLGGGLDARCQDQLFK